MSAFCWTPISLWRMATWVRLAWRTLVSSSRKPLTLSTTRMRWSWMSRKYSPSSPCMPGDQAVDQAVERLGERGGRLVELDHLALEQVDALGRVAALVGEDLGLDLLDVLVEAVDHRLVVVDDPVEDRVQHRPGAEAEQVGPALDPLADVAEGAGRLVADRDHELGADEEHDLAELDGVVGVDVAGGLEDHEQGVVVDLELGPLVGVDGVLDGQLVQVELAPDRVELRLVRLVQPDPDKGVVGVPGLVRLVQGHLARPALAVLADRAVDDHAGIVP